MGAPIDRDAIVERFRAYTAAWAERTVSTEPADRPRAESAIAALYAADGRTAPKVVWVPSPAAGVLAYGVLTATHRRIRSPYTRGDTGTGANRDTYALAEPIALEPGWRQRLHDRLRARLLDGVGLARLGLRTSGELTIAEVDVLWPAVQRALARVGPPEVATASGPCDPATLDALGGQVLGPLWSRLEVLLGPDLARGVLADSVMSGAQTIVDAATRRTNAVEAVQPGQFDAVTPVLATVRDIFGERLWRPARDAEQRVPRIDARLELARSAGPWWALEDVAVVSERPLRLRRDDRGRPHSPDGPALAWPDGFEVWAWHGVVVDPWVITAPHRITVDKIDSEMNVEARRVLIERFGMERLIREGGARLVHEDETGRLWQRPVGPAGGHRWFRPPGWDEPILMVEVTNSTPEPDGSHKSYFLRVPPSITTARQAVAWTFQMREAEYAPLEQT